MQTACVCVYYLMFFYPKSIRNDDGWPKGEKRQREMKKEKNQIVYNAGYPVFWLAVAAFWDRHNNSRMTGTIETFSSAWRQKGRNGVWCVVCGPAAFLLWAPPSGQKISANSGPVFSVHYRINNTEPGPVLRTIVQIKSVEMNVVV